VCAVVGAEVFHRAVGLLLRVADEVAEGIEQRRADELFECFAVADGRAHVLERVDDGIDDARRGVADGAVEVEENVVVFFHGVSRKENRRRGQRAACARQRRGPPDFL